MLTLAKGHIPKSLHGYRLEREHGGILKKIIFIIIVALVILWFVNRDLVLQLWDWILNLFQK